MFDTLGKAARSSGTVRRAFAAPIVLALLVAACGGSHMSPSPTVESVGLSANATALTQAGATTQVAATAVFSSSTSRDVTTACTTWQSDTPSVLTVSSGGLLTAHAAGAATITATCDSVAARVVVTVSFSGQRLWLSGTVTDAITGWGLSNVLVQITDGVNAGVSTQTGAGGGFNFINLTPDTFTVSASGPQAYLQATQSVVLAADTRGVTLALPRAPADVVTPYDLTLTLEALTNCVAEGNIPTNPGQLVPTQSFTSSGVAVGSSLQYIALPSASVGGGLVDLELQRNGTAASGTLTFSLYWPGAFHSGTFLTDAPVSGAIDANGQFSGTASGLYDNETSPPTYIHCNIQLGVVLTPHQ